MISAYSLFTQWDNSIEKIGNTLIPAEWAPFCLICAIGLLGLGSISIIFDIWPTYGHLCMIAFLVPVTLLMHTKPCLEARWTVK